MLRKESFTTFTSPACASKELTDLSNVSASHRLVVAIAVAFMGLGSAAAFAGQLSKQMPAAPQVTVGADIKLLRFDWDPVAGAQHYRLLKNPDGHSGFRQVGPDIPRTTTIAVDAIAVHLHDWADARY